MIENGQDKNQDLHHEIEDILSKKQWAETLLERVNNIRNSQGANRAKELSRLETEILMQVDPRNNENLIDAKVRESCGEFLKKLQHQFYELTENEVLFCGYIRLDFNSADIAVLKGIELSSVNMARHRLKKKLNLEKEQGLDEFIKAY